jgi:hypothetical protein
VLIPDCDYLIVKGFQSFDGEIFEVGTQLKFLGSDFLPHEDGLTLNFLRNSEPVKVCLQWCEEV